VSLSPASSHGVGGGLPFTAIAKTTQTSIASNVTPALDPELRFAFASGGVYWFYAVLIYASPAGAGTPDLKLYFGEDATARGTMVGLGFSTSDVASNAGVLCNSAGTLGYGTAAANRTIYLQGTYTGTGNAAGVAWSQNTSSTNATVMQVGSALYYFQVA